MPDDALSARSAWVRGDAGELILVAGPGDVLNAAVAGFLIRLGATPPLEHEGELPSHGPLDEVHGAILTEAGCAANDPRRPPEDWFARPAAARYPAILFETLLASFADLDFAVLQDTRLCPLLPLWRDAAAAHHLGLNVVLAIGDPLEDARALHAAQGVPVASGALLWASRVLAAERGSRHLPRHVLLRDDLATGWLEVADAVEAAFAPNWPRARRAEAADMETELARLRDAATASEDAAMASPRIPDLVHETFEAVRALAGGADPEALFGTFDRLDAALTAACDVLGPSLRAAETSRAALTRDLGRSRQRIGAAEKRAAAQSAARRTAERKRARTKAALNTARARIGRLTARIRCRDALEPPPEPDLRTIITGMGRRWRDRESKLIAEVRAAPEFDPDWYLASYPDVAGSGLEPALHFVRYGARRGRSPGPGFDTMRYYEAYPDILKAGQIAVLHYRRHGCSEGLKAYPVRGAE